MIKTFLRVHDRTPSNSAVGVNLTQVSYIRESDDGCATFVFTNGDELEADEGHDYVMTLIEVTDEEVGMTVRLNPPKNKKTKKAG